MNFKLHLRRPAPLRQGRAIAEKLTLLNLRQALSRPRAIARRPVLPHFAPSSTTGQMTTPPWATIPVHHQHFPSQSTRCHPKLNDTSKKRSHLRHAKSAQVDMMDTRTPHPPTSPSDLKFFCNCFTNPFCGEMDCVMWSSGKWWD